MCSTCLWNIGNTADFDRALDTQNQYQHEAKKCQIKVVYSWTRWGFRGLTIWSVVNSGKRTTLHGVNHSTEHHSLKIYVFVGILQLQTAANNSYVLTQVLVAAQTFLTPHCTNIHKLSTAREDEVMGHQKRMNGSKTWSAELSKT